VAIVLNIIFLLFTKFKILVNVKALFRTLLLFSFIFGQIGALAHAHDHSHEHSDDEKQTACVVCILAINDDELAKQDTDLPDVGDGPSFLKTSVVLTSRQNDGQVIGWYFLATKKRPYSQLLDAARAPPLNQHLS